MNGRSSPPLPRVAVAFRADSPSALALSRSASGRYELVWLIDSATAELGPLARLLERLGPVVDVAGLDEAAAAAALGRESPIGIVTFSDELIEPTSPIAARLGLPFPDPVVAERLTDKAAQRSALAAAGLAIPRCCLVPAGTDGTALAALVDGVRYPAVLKPCRGHGSRDVLLVRDHDALRSALQLLGDVRRDEPLLVEEYLADGVGDPDFAGYLSVESVVFRHRVQHLATNGRFPTAPPFRETGFFIPAALPDGLEAGVLALVDAAVAALGVERGVLHSEVKLTPEGPRLIEINGRPGGGVAEMLASIAPVDLYRIAFDLAADRYDQAVTQVPRGPVAYLFYVQAQDASGTVTAVEGLDELAREPGVGSVFLNRPPGSLVDWRDGNHGYVYSVAGVLDDHDRLRAFARDLPRRVRVEIEPAAAASHVGAVVAGAR